MTDTTENSTMFSLGALVRNAPTPAAEPDEPPQTSLRDVRFAPVLAAPVVAPERPRVGGWVIAVGLVAMLAPIAATAIYVTRSPAPVRASRTTSTTTTIATTTASTVIETPTSTATVTEAPREEPPVHHKPRATTITTATATSRAREAPKCCPGETEMACAMRRSVGAACGA